VEVKRTVRPNWAGVAATLSNRAKTIRETAGPVASPHVGIGPMASAATHPVVTLRPDSQV